MTNLSRELLEPEAAHVVGMLLPDNANGDLSSLCIWPDQIRRWYKYRWTSPLHFIDTPDEACSFDYENNMTEALLFLSHFMGDIHQPMHVGFTSDEGGNTINMRWFRHKSAPCMGQRNNSHSSSRLLWEGHGLPSTRHRREFH